MSTSGIEIRGATARSIAVTPEALTVELADGRTLSVPLTWFPRLNHGSETERRRWVLIGGGEGIRWPDLDEDISVESLLAGRSSAESQDSLRRWLEGRKQRP